jgi:hypothetical protein
MCLFRRQLDPKTRRRMVVANLSLIFGILLWNSAQWGWIHLSSQFEQNWLDAITGFLFGLYIAIALLGMWRARRCGATGSVKL